MHILKHYKFITKSTFLDVHPATSFKRLSGYLMNQPILEGKTIDNYFEPVRFSNEMIRDSFITVPMLSEMREKYLKILLKLKHLERKSNEKPP